MFKAFKTFHRCALFKPLGQQVSVVPVVPPLRSVPRAVNSGFHHRIHRDLAVSVTGRSLSVEKAQPRATGYPV